MSYCLCHPDQSAGVTFLGTGGRQLRKRSCSGCGSDMPASELARDARLAKMSNFASPVASDGMKKAPQGGFFHTVGGSRTHDPLLRRQLLYPTELREQLCIVPAIG